MRLSIDTLILLARMGDRCAEITAIFLGKNQDAEAWTCNEGRIGAGWPGVATCGLWTSNVGGLS